MDRESLRRAIAEFDGSIPIESAWTPPSSWYTSAAIFEHERAAVFARAWQPVARDDELAGPGAYASGCLFGQPWLLVRDDDGDVRGFHNTCRHKGREVVVGAGVAESLVCGYHGWTYDRRGRLRSAPRVAGIASFDREAMGLPPLAVERWGPWWFVNFEGSGNSLAGEVAEVDERLAATRWERLDLAGRQSWTLGCNWKVYVDNFLDGGYHVPFMHPSLDAQIDMDSYRTEVFGVTSIQSAGPRRAPDDGGLDYDPRRRIGERAIYAWVFPNFMINRYGPCLDSNLVIPLGPDRCEVHYEFYFDPEVGGDSQAFVDASMAQADVTQHEDIDICESVQRGLSSRSYDRGRYAPRVEVGEHHFHCLLADRLQAGLG